MLTTDPGEGRGLHVLKLGSAAEKDFEITFDMVERVTRGEGRGAEIKLFGDFLRDWVSRMISSAIFFEKRKGDAMVVVADTGRN